MLITIRCVFSSILTLTQTHTELIVFSELTIPLFLNGHVELLVRRKEQEPFIDTLIWTQNNAIVLYNIVLCYQSSEDMLVLQSCLFVFVLYIYILFCSYLLLLMYIAKGEFYSCDISDYYFS